jgi:peptidoglycan/LPS O-acetylase OafA/YrhL
MFIIGALLAKNIEYIKKRITMMKLRYKKLLFLAGIILYLYFHPSFLFNMVINGFNPYYRTVIDSWFTTIGAAILIVLAISTNFISKILRNKVINHIGKISYSLYLSHLTVLLSCVHFLNKQMPIWSILLIVILLTFVLSNILYYLVEKPTIKLGKYLTRLISRSLKNKSRNENTVRIS